MSSADRTASLECGLLSLHTLSENSDGCSKEEDLKIQVTEPSSFELVTQRPRSFGVPPVQCCEASSPRLW